MILFYVVVFKVMFKDNDKWLSGWIHDYYCDFDGAQLVFDPNDSSNFECPICHYQYHDDKKRRAWVTKYRYQIFHNLEEYSKRYLLEKEEKYLKYIEEALKYYSLNYNNFEIHDKTGNIFNTDINPSNRCGKITAQGLNEAMITIQMVNCIHNIDFYLKNEIKQNVYDSLFPNIFQLLKPQINKIHNINCYEICAIGMMGMSSKNEEMIDFAFHSPFSFYEQLDQGVTKDYFWFEGSFHYHLFVLKPILELLILAREYHYFIPDKYYNIAKMMLLHVYQGSFSDCSLPSPNDGWPNLHLSCYIEVFQLGNQLFENEFTEVLNNIYEKKNLYYTTHFIDTGFSILKNKYWNVFIKYQDNDINHAHPDKLNIEIKHGNHFLTHDLSNSGYGSNMSKEFYKKTYAHNTIVINGVDQNLTSKAVVTDYNDHMISVKVIDAYEKVEMSRKIELFSNELNDELIVTYLKDNIVDYFLHCDAKLITKIENVSAIDLKEYPYLKNVREVQTKKSNIILEWNLNGETIFSYINLEGKKLYICESPDNPNKNWRTTLLIRNLGKQESITFYIKWKISK